MNYFLKINFFYKTIIKVKVRFDFSIEYKEIPESQKIVWLNHKLVQIFFLCILLKFSFSRFTFRDLLIIYSLTQ